MKKKIFSILFALMLVLSFSLVTAVPAAASPGDLHVPGEYPTIQAAVGAATAGDTIIVAAGIYDEQVVIDKSLTLQGAGYTTLIRPSSETKLTSFYTLGTQTGAYWNGKKLASIISIDNVGTDGVTVKDLRVDGRNVDDAPVGADYIAGISFGETAGTIENVTVVKMNTTSQEPRTYGVWLDAVATDVSVNVKGCYISLYNKNGINARGAKLTVSIHDNTVTGPGEAPEVPNGILLINGASGTISNNIITSHEYTGEYTACGIALFDVAGIIVEKNTISDCYTGVGLSGESGVSGTRDTIVRGNTISGAKTGVQLECRHTFNNTITGNNIQTNEYGIYLEGPESPDWEANPGFYEGYEVGAGNVAYLNNITGNTIYGVANFNPDEMFDAENNWWGDASGPEDTVGTNEVPPCTDNPTTEINADGTGDKVSDNVDYCPWLTELMPESTGAVTMVASYIPRIGISVDPTSVDFGSVVPGTASGTKNIHVTNTGNVTEDFSATVENESPANVYTQGLKIATKSVAEWSETDVAVGEIKADIALVLTVPSGTAPGTYTATLVFWAEMAE